MLRRAKEASEGGERMALLMECLSLFERSAGSLSLDNLKDAVDEFRELRFFSGSVQLALAVAKYSDPSGAGIDYAAQGRPKDVFQLLTFSDNRIHVQCCMRNEFVATLSSSKSSKTSTFSAKRILRLFNVFAHKHMNSSTAPTMNYSIKHCTIGMFHADNQTGFSRCSPQPPL